jgi:hypothetical protein
MSLRTVLSPLCFAVAIFTSSPLLAQLGDDEINYDTRIKEALEEAELNYNIVDNGNFHLVFELESGRTQLVIIKSKTFEYGPMEIREIISIAAKSDNKKFFKRDMLFDVLERNEQYVLGAWQIDGGEAPYFLEFSVKVSANANPKILSNALILAAKVADEVEQELSGDTDEF